MHEFHSNVNKVNKAVAKVRTIGDRLPLTLQEHFERDRPLITVKFPSLDSTESKHFLGHPMKSAHKVQSEPKIV